MNDDEKFMNQCIVLSKRALESGEMPFASLIVCEGEVVCESMNNVAGKKDVTAHAEIAVMQQAQRKLTPEQISRSALYTNVEPCPMCSFMIRELKFARVVFAIHSPFMGGFSKWPILQDTELERYVGFFAKPPEVVAGMLEDDAEEVWSTLPVSLKDPEKGNGTPTKA